MAFVENVNIEKTMVFNHAKSFYYFLAIKRKKDHPECTMKDSQVIQTWIVKDVREFWYLYKTQMISIVKDNKCRLYMCTDRKSYSKTLLSIRNDINKQLDSAVENERMEYSPKTLVDLLPSNIMRPESSDRKLHKWLFDIDTKDKRVLDIIIKLCGSSYEVTLETKNGYHVIAKRAFAAPMFLQILKTDGMCVGFNKDEFTKEEIGIIQENHDKVDVKPNALALVAMDC